jgi:hypothetical protein
VIHDAWKKAHNMARTQGLHQQGLRRTKEPSKKHAGYIRARLDETRRDGVPSDEALKVCLHMVGPWLWTATTGHAPLLRKGENTGLYTLFKPTLFEDRYSQAEGHMGRGVSRSETHAHNGYILPPEKAFAHALAIVVRHGEHFDRWHEDDRTHAALARAVSSCGGRRWVGEVTQYTRREREGRLCEAFRREWGGVSCLTATTSTAEQSTAPTPRASIRRWSKHENPMDRNETLDG